jgi:hypothetical protein
MSPTAAVTWIRMTHGSTITSCRVVRHHGQSTPMAAISRLADCTEEDSSAFSNGDSFVACGTVRGRGRFDSARPVTTASMNAKLAVSEGKRGLIFRASGFRLGCEAERKVLSSYVLRRVNPRASANQLASLTSIWGACCANQGAARQSGNSAICAPRCGPELLRSTGCPMRE